MYVQREETLSESSFVRLSDDVSVLASLPFVSTVLLGYLLQILSLAYFCIIFIHPPIYSPIHPHHIPPPRRVPFLLPQSFLATDTPRSARSNSSGTPREQFSHSEEEKFGFRASNAAFDPHADTEACYQKEGK
jgi:hypothetical protein